MKKFISFLIMFLLLFFTTANAATIYNPNFVGTMMFEGADITPSADMQAFLGSADYDTARTNLGLAIGTNVQAHSDILDGLAGVTPANNGIFGYNNSGELGLYTNHSHDDSAAHYFNATDSTKLFQYDLQYMTTGKKITYQPTAADNYSYKVTITGNTDVTMPTSGTIVSSGVSTGGLIFGDSSPDSAGEIAYDGALKYYDASASRTVANLDEAQTLTNKTITVSDTEFIPVAWMIDGAAAPAALATTDLGTRQVKTRAFQGDTADQDLEMFWQAPSDIADGDGGTAGFQVKWRPIFVITSATAPGSGEGVALALQSCSVGSGDTGDCTVGTASVIADADLDAHAQFDIVYGGWTAITVTDGAAGEAWMMKLYRDQDNEIDDYAQPIGLIGIEVKYVKNITNGY